mmetsp:Transcript_8229/g.19343  ORF Transcript_8229/g.19343 Transcript_8229/m.19343 type:complete len:260 (+) Transcript_8229:62-841(+)
MDLDDGLPFATRADTMYMRSVDPKDPAADKCRFPKLDDASLRTSDIDGARPFLRHRRLYPDGPAVKDGVPGSFSKRHYPEVNRVVGLSLNVKDIEGAEPKSRIFTTKRQVNPLTPRYDLPSCEMRACTPPRQVVHEGVARANLEHVGLTQPRIPAQALARSPDDEACVEQLQMHQYRRKFLPPSPREVLRVEEQAGGRTLATKLNTSRQTNPLNPVYQLPSRCTHPVWSGTFISRGKEREEPRKGIEPAKSPRYVQLTS